MHRMNAILYDIHTLLVCIALHMLRGEQTSTYNKIEEIRQKKESKNGEERVKKQKEQK